MTTSSSRLAFRHERHDTASVDPRNRSKTDADRWKSSERTTTTLAGACLRHGRTTQTTIIPGQFVLPSPSLAGATPLAGIVPPVPVFLFRPSVLRMRLSCGRPHQLLADGLPLPSPEAPRWLLGPTGSRLVRFGVDDATGDPRSSSVNS